jgi:hypothetical protein
MKSWLPWQFLLRVAARRRGFIDPIELLARLRRFAQPSEVQEPIELVRAGVIFHARGLINTKVFQYNLDWIWPYWVVRQFDPADPSFLPRAFSFSHVNLTHRNWTALGVPGMDDYPIVDPRGLVTLPVDPWSLDWWFVPEQGEPLYPSHVEQADQQLDFGRGLEVITRCAGPAGELRSSAVVERVAGAEGLHEVIRLEATVRSRTPGLLVLAARPANPEGVHFIEHIHFADDGWQVNSRYRVHLNRAPQAMVASTYAHGDLPSNLTARFVAGEHVRCPAGMATAAATFHVHAGEPLTVGATVELSREKPVPIRARSRAHSPGALSWDEALTGTPELDVPEPRWKFLHDAALRTIVLLSPNEIFPGPSTYRRFWFRDACLVMHALLAANLNTRVRRALDGFPARQRADGYFHSQEGEWDANGQVLWIADLYERALDQKLPAPLWAALTRGATWITRKRQHPRSGIAKGLLPPGFSAEHLGPVDQYYWDDFWGLAGLEAASRMAARRGDHVLEHALREQAEAFAQDVRRNLDDLPPAVAQRGVPASPHRRMDAGAIGSMVADYPLRLDHVVTHDAMLRSADWLWRHCRHAGGFFQDMVHSGINAYLTLGLAQTFMRHGDHRHMGLIDAVAHLASPTGQWPEAVHPRTLGGCMGDGQHTWAAAEWILALRASFVREEASGLVIGAGLRETWFEQAEQLSYGPTATGYGSVRVTFVRRQESWFARVHGRWHRNAPRVRFAIAGFAPSDWAIAQDGEYQLTPLQTHV